MSEDDTSIKLTLPSAAEIKTWNWSQQTPTAALRFVTRDGKRILQQMWFLTTMSHQTSEWRDVPFEEE